MAFKNVFNFKQAIMQDMEYNLWARETEKPGALGSKDDWENYFKYQYYRRLKLNCIDEGPVALSTTVILDFMKTTFDRITTITDGAMKVPVWDSPSDIWPAVELVSIPIISSDGKINPGKKMDIELSVNDYPLYFGNVKNILSYFTELEKKPWKSEIELHKLGTLNKGYRRLTSDVTALMSSDISTTDIELIPGEDETKLDVLYRYINPTKMISLTPRKEDLWEKSADTNINYIYKGKTPPRTPVIDRSILYYYKFSYYDDNGNLLGYRYIPLLPNLANSTTTNLEQYTSDQTENIVFRKENFYNFGFQPFNDFEIYETKEAGATNYLSSLPGICFASSESFNIFSCGIFPSGTIPYMNIQVWLDVNELGQYLYLCGLKFTTNEDTAINGSFDSLDTGVPPTIDSGGGGEGETAGPSGTISGGDKIDVEAPGVAGGGGASSGTVIKTYPVIDSYIEPGFYGGVYIPTYRYIMEIKDDVLGYSKNDEAVNKLNQIIRNLTALGKLDSLVEVFMTYSGFINGVGMEKVDGQVVDNRYKLPVISINLERPVYLCGYNSTNGYLPKNNKLLSYPYLSFEINGYGEMNELKPENWSSETPTINVCSKFLPGSPIFVFPSNYNGIQYNYDAGVAGQPLPILPYTKDSYKNEYNACINSRTAAITSLTETSVSNGIYSILGGVAGATGAGLQGHTKSYVNLERGAEPFYNKTSFSGTGMSDISGARVVKGAQNLTNSLLSYHQGLREFEAQLKDVENRPLAIANQNASPSLPYLNSNAGAPYIVWKSIRREFAEKIDEFFSRYGYRVNKFKEVNINTRPVFNFLKCSQARVDGSIPQEDLITIKGILEKGITFWHDPTKILDYTVDNPAPKKDAPIFLQPTYKKLSN